MRIAFVVNDIQTEQTNYTTTHLAMTAVNLGHDVYYISVGDFVRMVPGLPIHKP